MEKYRLEEVKTTAQKRKFLDMAAELYRNDTVWVHPLDHDIEAVFDEAKNPLFEKGEAIRWLLTDTATGKTVGRIAAFYNRDLAAADPFQPTGGCGFFECIDDQRAANILFDAARDWLAEHGLEAMDGSINFGDRQQWWGVLVEGFTQPIYGMNYNHPYYGKLFEAYGFQNYFNQLSYLRVLELDKMGMVYQKAERLYANPDYEFRPVDMSDLGKVARDFMEVYNSGWATYSGIKDMDFEHTYQLVKGMKPIIDPDVIYFAYHKGQPIGFFVMIPDLNQIIGKFKGKLGLWQKLKLVWALKRKKCDRLFGLVFGVSKAFQGRGVEAGMIKMFEDFVRRNPERYLTLEIAWVGDFNPLMMRVVESYVMAVKYKRHVTYRYLFDRTAAFTRHPRVGKVSKKASS